MGNNEYGLEEYAERISNTVKRIILDNSNCEELYIDSIKIGVEQAFIRYTSKGNKVIKRYED